MKKLTAFLLTIIFSSMVLAKDSISIETLLKEVNQYKKDGKVYLNFENIDLKLLSYFIAQLTGKNIIVDPRVRGDVSLIFSKPVSIKQAWDIYTSILRSRNYLVVNKGNFVEVLPVSLLRDVVPPVNKENSSEEITTLVYRLSNADAAAVANIIRGLKSPKGLVYSYNPANVVIISDTASNINNLKRVISLIDIKDISYAVKVYRLKYINASEVAGILTALYSNVAKKGIFFKAVGLKIQNAVVVRAPSDILSKINSFIKKIDVPAENISQRRLWTMPVKNIKASEIADVLNKLLENTAFIKTTSDKKNKPVVTSTTFKDRPKVIAEKTGNILVIYANKAEYEAIRSIVESIDKQKKQILITAFITEISMSALQEIGVKWQAFGSYGGTSFKGGISDSAFYNLLGSSNFIAGILSKSGKTLDVGGSTLFFPDLLFVLSLLEKGSGFKIISSPKILAMDNMKAKINVSQVIPYAQSVKYDVNGNPIVNYNYKEVGLILEVTPHISGKNIIMDIHQEVNDIIGFESANVGNLSYIVPKTSKREINTSIIVENGRTVVLGGLISKKTVQSMEGVPFFSDIPLIGNLFKYRSNSRDKTNLFVFITPFIIEKPEDLAKITQEHMKLARQLEKFPLKVQKQVEKSKGKDIFEDYRKYFGGQ